MASRAGEARLAEDAPEEGGHLRGLGLLGVRDLRGIRLEALGAQVLTDRLAGGGQGARVDDEHPLDALAHQARQLVEQPRADHDVVVPADADPGRAHPCSSSQRDDLRDDGVRLAAGGVDPQRGQPLVGGAPLVHHLGPLGPRVDEQQRPCCRRSRSGARRPRCRRRGRRRRGRPGTPGCRGPSARRRRGRPRPRTPARARATSARSRSRKYALALVHEDVGDAAALGPLDGLVGVVRSRRRGPRRAAGRPCSCRRRAAR